MNDKIALYFSLRTISTCHCGKMENVLHVWLKQLQSNLIFLCQMAVGIWGACRHYLEDPWLCEKQSILLVKRRDCSVRERLQVRSNPGHFLVEGPSKRKPRPRFPIWKKSYNDGDYFISTHIAHLTQINCYYQISLLPFILDNRILDFSWVLGV